jgi:ribonuclease BN (tRNA processing enzyme)
MGTGLTYLGRDFMARSDIDHTRFRATILASHLHWDHIQGLPFFTPLLQPTSSVIVYGPAQGDRSLADAFGDSIRPPMFPVTLAQLPGEIEFRELDQASADLGAGITITGFPVPHVGPTNGYRIDSPTGSMVFICDHQQPYDGSLDVPESVVEACAGADLLIHDSQYDAEEFARKRDWGHCTPDYALEVARRAEVSRLALFHHDPTHDDAWIKDQVDRIDELAGPEIEVFGAAEGECVISGGP